MLIEVGKKYKEREGGDIILIVFDNKTIFPQMPDDHSARFVGVSSVEPPNDGVRFNSYGYNMDGRLHHGYLDESDEYDLVEEVV